MTMTTIKPIPGYDGYGASADGHIWRITPPRANATSKGRALPYRLKPLVNRKLNYKYVNLYLPQHVTRYVHKLVAETFLGPLPERHCLHHKNGRKHDNRVKNLEYVSCAKHCHVHSDSRGSFTRKVMTRDVRHILRCKMRPKEIVAKYGLTYRSAWDITHGRAWGHVYKEVTGVSSSYKRKYPSKNK